MWFSLYGSTSAYTLNNRALHKTNQRYIQNYKWIKIIKTTHIPIPMDTTQWHNLQQNSPTKRNISL